MSLKPEHSESRLVLEELGRLFKNGSHLHLMAYKENAEVNSHPYWSLAVSSKFCEMPRNHSGLLKSNESESKAAAEVLLEEPQVFRIWGDPTFSSINKNNSEAACHETAMAFSYVLTLLGYEVFLNNKEFNLHDETQEEA